MFNGMGYRQRRNTGILRCAQNDSSRIREKDLRVFQRILRKICAAGIGMLSIHCAAQLQPVATRAFDNSRSGDNTHETILTPARLLATGIGRQTTIPLWGDGRGTEGQPLIMPGVKLADGSTHDVMVLPSMANWVRGVDAETGANLWTTPPPAGFPPTFLGTFLGTPINGSNAIDSKGINDKWGVLSTGVIDPDTQRVYLVAWVSRDGTPQNGVHFVYVLNIADGSLVCPPVSLAGLTSRGQAYNSLMRKQRSALLLTNAFGRKTVFFSMGTVQETQNGAAGWIFAFDCATNTISAALAMSDGLGAGIWMGAQGLAADAQGFLYGITGNGSFNGATDFGECVFKVQYTPPTATAKAALRVVSWWSPYSDAGRTGLNPQLSGPPVLPQNKLAGMSMPTEAVKLVNEGMTVSLKNARVVNNTNNLGKPVQLVFPKLPTNTAWDDEDLGSGGGTLTPYGVYIASGKDGIGYAVKTANMGNTNPADFANAAANCLKLAGPPVWMTEDPGPVNPCPQLETTLNFMPWGKTRHMHMTPVQYMSPTRGLTLFVWGENSQLHAWTVSTAGALTYLAQGNEVASANVVNTPGGMPGGFCSLSSNGNTLGTAVLWCSIPYGDANATVTNGRLLAYDPENLVANPDGSKGLRVLWDSQAQAIPYVYNKFQPPIVWNGRVYLPNYNGGVDVYR